MAVFTEPGNAFQRIWQWKWRILIVVVVVGLTALALWLTLGRAQPAAVTNPVVGPKPVVAQAGVVPAVERKLGFKAAGVIKEMNAVVGAKVKAGDVLAKLDSSALQLKVEEAQANLTIQTQTIIQTTEVAPADLNAARAALSSALARQDLVESGAAPGDVKAAQEAVAVAQAGVASAQAQVEKLSASASTSDLAAGDASVRSAEAQLAAANQKLNDTKARPQSKDVSVAELAVEQAKNTLWSQQVSRDSVCGAVGSNAGQCKSADASVAAAETAVRSAQTDFDAAKLPASADELATDEAGVRSATAAVSSANQELAKVKSGSAQVDRDAAQAGLDQANANLRSAQAKLEQVSSGSTDADRKSAASAVEQARASLAKLTSDPTAATVELSKARVHQADVALAEAELALQDASLVAPIDGVVTSMPLHPGDLAAVGATVMTVADLTTLHFETNDLDEISAQKVHVGQHVLVTIPALDKRSFEGMVSDLASEPTITQSGDVHFVARITLSSPPPELRWGQTGRVEFSQ